MDKIIIKLAFVFILAAGELWVAIPAGLAIKLKPLTVALVSLSGAVMGSLLVIFLGERLRRLFSKKNEEPKPAGLIYKIWQKYGIIGLGLLAPLVTGAPLGAALGVSLGAEPRKLLLWITSGIVLWTVILTIAASFGIELIKF